MVAGDVVSQLAGIIGGPETRPHQAIRGGQRATTLTVQGVLRGHPGAAEDVRGADRKSTRLNSSHVAISYAVFCLKKKKEKRCHRYTRLHDCINARKSRH